MKVFRIAALAWVAAAALFVTSLASVAQEAEPELKDHTYDLAGLTRSEFHRTPRNGGIGDVLAPDQLFSEMGYNHREDRWSLRHSGDEARCWDESSETMSAIAGFCNPEGAPLEYNATNPSEGEHVKLRTTVEVHRRVAFVLAAMREMARARVSIKVLRIEGQGSVGDAVLAPDKARQAQKSSRLVGTLHGGLGERMVLQRLQHQSYIADYDVSVATGATSPVSVVSDMRTGEELVAGAIMLPGGRVWLQAWHASMKLDEMRKLDTNCGQVELPRVSYSFSPLSAVMARGSGAILDAGQNGRFLLVADCDTAIENRTLPLENGGSLELFNLAGMLQARSPDARWIMTPNVNRVIGDGVSLDQVFLEDPMDGPYHDAAMLANDWLSNSVSIGEGISVAHLGPFLAVMTRPPQNDAEAKAAHDVIVEQLRAGMKHIARDPAPITVRVRAWIVNSSVTLPEGVIDGKPDSRDLGAMEAIGAPALDRTTAGMVGQSVDLMDLTLAAHLRDYQTMLAQQATGIDPQVGVLALGKQVRWIARPSEQGRLRVEVRTAVTVGPQKFEQIPWGEEKKWNIERSLSDLAQADMAGELGMGEGISTICPAGSENSLLVMTVERIK
ncbi:MAG: hypothetical protein IT461_12135 [Planctomycetes bacterium]|nr:hypothetical protein [Planctomycetota bacterium]